MFSKSTAAAPLRQSTSSQDKATVSSFLSADQSESRRVRCFVRVRPLIPDEIQQNAQSCVSVGTDRCSIKLHQEKPHTFDSIFEPDTPLQEVCEATVVPAVYDILKGYHSTTMLYGQTCSGKTYTLSQLMPTFIETLFRVISEESDEYETSIKMECQQVYMENIYDLLDVSRTNLQIREFPDTGVFVKDSTQVTIRSTLEFYHVWQRACANRIFGATKLNRDSSRSHCIYIIDVSRRRKITREQFSTSREDSLHFASVGSTPQRGGASPSMLFTEGNLNGNRPSSAASSSAVLLKGRSYFVDLAGSERLKKSQSEGLRLAEAQNINTSLAALGQVMHALTDPKATHIPYRDSKLTRLLQDSLGGSGHSRIIVTVSPANLNGSETRFALQFGMRAMKIRSTVTAWKELDGKAKLIEQQDWLETRVHFLEAKVSQLEQEKEEVHLRLAASGNNIITPEKQKFLHGQDTGACCLECNKYKIMAEENEQEVFILRQRLTTVQEDHGIEMEKLQRYIESLQNDCLHYKEMCERKGGRDTNDNEAEEGEGRVTEHSRQMNALKQYYEGCLLVEQTDALEARNERDSACDEVLTLSAKCSKLSQVFFQKEREFALEKQTLEVQCQHFQDEADQWKRRGEKEVSSLNDLDDWHDAKRKIAGGSPMQSSKGNQENVVLIRQYQETIEDLRNALEESSKRTTQEKNAVRVEEEGMRKQLETEVQLLRHSNEALLEQVHELKKVRKEKQSEDEDAKKEKEEKLIFSPASTSSTTDRNIEAMQQEYHEQVQHMQMDLHNVQSSWQEYVHRLKSEQETIVDQLRDEAALKEKQLLLSEARKSHHHCYAEFLLGIMTIYRTESRVFAAERGAIENEISKSKSESLQKQQSEFKGILSNEIAAKDAWQKYSLELESKIEEAAIQQRNERTDQLSFFDVQMTTLFSNIVNPQMTLFSQLMTEKLQIFFKTFEQFPKLISEKMQKRYHRLQEKQNEEIAQQKMEAENDQEQELFHLQENFRQTILELQSAQFTEVFFADERFQRQGIAGQESKHLHTLQNIQFQLQKKYSEAQLEQHREVFKQEHEKIEHQHALEKDEEYEKLRVKNEKIWKDECGKYQNEIKELSRQKEEKLRQMAKHHEEEMSKVKLEARNETQLINEKKEELISHFQKVIEDLQNAHRLDLETQKEFFNEKREEIVEGLKQEFEVKLDEIENNSKIAQSKLRLQVSQEVEKKLNEKLEVEFAEKLAELKTSWQRDSELEVQRQMEEEKRLLTENLGSQFQQEVGILRGQFTHEKQKALNLQNDELKKKFSEILEMELRKRLNLQAQEFEEEKSLWEKEQNGNVERQFSKLHQQIKFFQSKSEEIEEKWTMCFHKAQRQNKSQVDALLAENEKWREKWNQHHQLEENKKSENRKGVKLLERQKRNSGNMAGEEGENAAHLSSYFQSRLDHLKEQLRGEQEYRQECEREKNVLREELRKLHSQLEGVQRAGFLSSLHDEGHHHPSTAQDIMSLRSAAHCLDNSSNSSPTVSLSSIAESTAAQSSNPSVDGAPCNPHYYQHEAADLYHLHTDVEQKRIIVLFENLFHLYSDYIQEKYELFWTHVQEDVIVCQEEKNEEISMQFKSVQRYSFLHAERMSRRHLEDTGFLYYLLLGEEFAKGRELEALRRNMRLETEEESRRAKRQKKHNSELEKLQMLRFAYPLQQFVLAQFQDLQWCERENLTTAEFYEWELIKMHEELLRCQWHHHLGSAVQKSEHKTGNAVNQSRKKKPSSVLLATVEASTQTIVLSDGMKKTKKKAAIPSSTHAMMPSSCDGSSVFNEDFCGVGPEEDFLQFTKQLQEIILRSSSGHQEKNYGENHVSKPELVDDHSISESQEEHATLSSEKDATNPILSSILSHYNFFVSSRAENVEAIRKQKEAIRQVEELERELMMVKLSLDAGKQQVQWLTRQNEELVTSQELTRKENDGKNVVEVTRKEELVKKTNAAVQTTEVAKEKLHAPHHIATSSFSSQTDDDVGEKKTEKDTTDHTFVLENFSKMNEIVHTASQKIASLENENMNLQKRYQVLLEEKEENEKINKELKSDLEILISAHQRQMKDVRGQLENAFLEMETQQKIQEEVRAENSVLLQNFTEMEAEVKRRERERNENKMTRSTQTTVLVLERNADTNHDGDAEKQNLESVWRDAIIEKCTGLSLQFTSERAAYLLQFFEQLQEIFSVQNICLVAPNVTSPLQYTERSEFTPVKWRMDPSRAVSPSLSLLSPIGHTTTLAPLSEQQRCDWTQPMMCSPVPQNTNDKMEGNSGSVNKGKGKEWNGEGTDIEKGNKDEGKRLQVVTSLEEELCSQEKLIHTLQEELSQLANSFFFFLSSKTPTTDEKNQEDEKIQNEEISNNNKKKKEEDAACPSRRSTVMLSEYMALQRKYTKLICDAEVYKNMLLFHQTPGREQRSGKKRIAAPKKRVGSAAGEREKKEELWLGFPSSASSNNTSNERMIVRDDQKTQKSSKLQKQQPSRSRSRGNDNEGKQERNKVYKVKQSEGKLFLLPQNHQRRSQSCSVGIRPSQQLLEEDSHLKYFHDEDEGHRCNNHASNNRSVVEPFFLDQPMSFSPPSSQSMKKVEPLNLADSFHEDNAVPAGGVMNALNHHYQTSSHSKVVAASDHPRKNDDVNDRQHRLFALEMWSRSISGAVHDQVGRNQAQLSHVHSQLHELRTLMASQSSKISPPETEKEEEMGFASNKDMLCSKRHSPTAVIKERGGQKQDVPWSTYSLLKRAPIY